MLPQARDQARENDASRRGIFKGIRPSSRYYRCLLVETQVGKRLRWNDQKIEPIARRTPHAAPQEELLAGEVHKRGSKLTQFRSSEATVYFEGEGLTQA
jgi:hypothetical protein